MPTFCRHNRLVQNCPICSKEQQVEMRAVVSSATPGAGRTAERSAAAGGDSAGSRASGASRGPRGTRGPRVVVRRIARGADDGYASPLVPGLRSSTEADHLAEAVAFGASRLALLASPEPPGLYAEVGAPGDLEERTWLAFLIALVGPAEEGDPFAALDAVRTPWASGELPDLAGLPRGARSALDPARPLRTVEAYRAWAGRSGSQSAAFVGEASWTAERRFARTFERLALPGFGRDARYDLLVTLGRLGVYELRAGTLQVGGDNGVTIAAKRALGIGDPLLLERRAAELAEACEVPIEALDVAFHAWERGEVGTIRFGVPAAAEPDPTVRARARAALGLD